MTDQLPRGTARLLVRELSGEPPVAKDYIDWAVSLLGSGLDSQTLRVLAGLDLGDCPSGFEAAAKFRDAYKELRLPSPGREELLRVYVREVASEIAVGAREPADAVDLIHREVLSPFNHPAEFSSWCYLWEGLNPVGFADLEGEALTSAIRDTARQWVASTGCS